jgi:hypothetical protein
VDMDPLALFAFHIGVEVGQLMFIAAALALLAVADVSIFHQSLDSRARHATTYGIGALAAFWFIERLAGVGYESQGEIDAPRGLADRSRGGENGR